MKHGDASICSSAVFLITWCSVQSWFPLLCVPSVSWLLCSSWCHEFVCSLWLWYLVFILIIFNLEYRIGPFERQLAQFWMSTGLLFIDNCWVPYRKIYSLQDCLILQEEFNSLALDSGKLMGKWNLMKPDVTLWEWLGISIWQNQFHFDYSLHNPTFGNVQSIKYIGITITDNTKKQDSGYKARKLRKCHNHRP